MTKAGALSLAALCSCAIDNRNVQVGHACVSPSSAVISDFPTARLGHCPPTTCPVDLEYTPTVSLGTAGVEGLVFLYQKPESVVLALGLTGDLTSASDSTSALRVVMSYDSLVRAVPTVVGGFALQFVDCVLTAGYVGVSFVIDGDLGSCPMRFAPHPLDSASHTIGAPCLLDNCFAATSVAVAAGITTVALAAPVNGETNNQALAGMQWEFGLPSDGARTCSADFTINEIRLIPGP